jgi:hypothetical protein
VIVVGFVCLGLSLVLLAAAKGRYTVQPQEERGPFWRTANYAIAGQIFAVAALVLIPQAGGPFSR